TADLERVRLALRERDEPEGLKEGSDRRGGRKAHPFEARADVLRREQVLRGSHEPAPHLVRGEEMQIGLQDLGPDGLVPRRGRLGRRTRREKEKEGPQETGSAKF